MRRAHLLVAVSSLVLVAACKGPAVPNPMTGESRYTCCNLHYEKTEITDANYLRGAFIPLGTRVQILEVRGNSVKFQPEGHPPLTLVLRYGRKALTMDQYLERIFVQEDPRARLPHPGRGKATAGADKIRKDIEQGVVDSGMTKDQVLMAIGYPPAHRTPSLASPVWTYWSNRWATYEVQFDGDRVARIAR